MATLYLRGVPDHLVRAAKAEAARRGITLTALVTEALASVVQAASTAAVALPDGLKAEMDWFEANKVRLLRRYRGQYLVIAGRRVIDHDRSFGALAKRVFKRMGSTPVFMPKCVEGERVVTLPSPRVVRA